MSESTPNIISLDGSSTDSREILGGKAYSVNRMRGLGLPVPPAFALPTHICRIYHENNRRLPEDLWDEVRQAIRTLEDETGRTFGAGPSPLLVSVRSGAAQSMPGMMDTVLNLGLTPDLVGALAEESADPAWAEDTWARFRRSYAEIVADVKSTGDVDPPADPWVQLRQAIGAVFDSWNNERVRSYRKRHGLSEGGGTAVTVQAMVFGNRGVDSGTGVLFSRDPSTGEDVLYGEWLANAQGEDVVSGEKTPTRLAELATSMPKLSAELHRIAKVLETEHRDMVDVEFTMENGVLYMLQCRKGKRSARAALTIAVDLAESGLITEDEALKRVTADHVTQLLDFAQIDDGETHVDDVLASGVGASPGLATGHVANNFEEVAQLTSEGKDVILVRTFTAPDDVPAMFQSVGVLTEVGGSTSHAALVCREIGLPCVVGAGKGLVEQLSGRVITIEGSSGKVYAEGSVKTSSASTNDYYLRTLAEYAMTENYLDHPIHQYASVASVER